MNAASAGPIVIDDFNNNGGTFGGSWWGYAYQAGVAGVSGGAREHSWYNYGTVKINTIAGTLEWTKPGSYPSQLHGLSYGSAIGSSGPALAASSNTGTALNLALTLSDEVVVEVLTASATDFRIILRSGNTEPFVYYANLTAGELRVPVSQFKSMWTNQLITAARAADIDGIKFYGEHHHGSKFGKFSIVPGVVDADGDGLNDDVDNCPAAANADQADLDGDGAGDACDSDIDGDGVANASDAFPSDASESADSDGDGVGDNADAFDNDPTETTDADGDGVGDNADAFDSSDMRATVIIGACDSGVANQHLGNGAWFNDLIAAAKASAANHGKFVSAVSALADGWKKSGQISGRDQGAIVSCAAKK